MSIFGRVNELMNSSDERTNRPMKIWLLVRRLSFSSDEFKCPDPNQSPFPAKAQSLFWFIHYLWEIRHGISEDFEFCDRHQPNKDLNSEPNWFSQEIPCLSLAGLIISWIHRTKEPIVRWRFNSSSDDCIFRRKSLNAQIPIKAHFQPKHNI